VHQGSVSGLSGEHKFYFKDIPQPWMKVDVNETLQPRVPLMFTAFDPNQEKIEDVKGICAMWHDKYIKFST